MKTRKQKWKNLMKLFSKSSAEENCAESSSTMPPRPSKTSATYPYLKGAAADIVEASEFATTDDAASDSSSSSSSTTEEEPLSIVFKCDSPFHNKGRVLMDATIACPLEEMYDLLFTPSKLFVETLKSEKMTGIKVGMWTPPSENGERRRITQFVAPVAGPGFTKIPATQHLRLLPCSKKGQFYAVDAKMVQHGIPYADAFYTQIHYCVEKVSPESTRILVTAQLLYTKSVWRFVKLFIDDLTWKTLERFYGALGGRVAQVDRITPERRRELTEIAECQLSFMEPNAQNGVNRGATSTSAVAGRGNVAVTSETNENDDSDDKSTSSWSDESCGASPEEPPWTFNDEKFWLTTLTFVANFAFDFLRMVKKTMKASTPMWALLAGLLLVVFGLSVINSQLYTRLWAAEERLSVVMVSHRLLLENSTKDIPGALLADHARSVGPVINMGNFMDDVKKHLTAAESAMRALRSELGITELELLDATELITGRQNASAVYNAFLGEGGT